MDKGEFQIIEKSAMVLGAESQDIVNDVIANKTFIGIDFGTSTTVVSVIKKDENGVPYSSPLQIAQPDGRGGVSEQEIVNSVLAWCSKEKNEGELLLDHP